MARPRLRRLGGSQEPDKSLSSSEDDDESCDPSDELERWRWGGREEDMLQGWYREQARKEDSQEAQTGDRPSQRTPEGPALGRRGN